MWWSLDHDDSWGSCGEGRFPLINAVNNVFKSNTDCAVTDGSETTTRKVTTTTKAITTTQGALSTDSSSNVVVGGYNDPSKNNININED